MRGRSYFHVSLSLQSFQGSQGRAYLFNSVWVFLWNSIQRSNILRCFIMSHAVVVAVYCHYQLGWVWKCLCLCSEAWCPVSMHRVGGCESFTHIHIILYAPSSIQSHFYIRKYVNLVSLVVSQGECGVRPCRGESSAHRLARCSRHLLWELQDDPGLEICKCPFDSQPHCVQG